MASGRTFSTTPDRACGPAPSSQSTVAVSESSQPGSVTTPASVIDVFSDAGATAPRATEGATFTTVTVVESSSETPAALVTRSPTVNTPLSPTSVNVVVTPVASSNMPSSSRSHS